jgi:hypothetical protein
MEVEKCKAFSMVLMVFSLGGDYPAKKMLILIGRVV